MKNELENFFKDKTIDSLEDVNSVMNEFVLKSWKDFIHNEISPEHLEAHKYLDKWDKKHNLRDIHKTLEIYPDCFLAKLYLVLDKDRWALIRDLEEMMDQEEKRLYKTGFMKKYKKGLEFTLDGEDYLKGINELIKAYISIGGFSRAAKLAEKILLLNKTDVLAIRFVLAGLYALLEEEDKLMKLYRSRKEKYIPYDLSFMCLYYKRGEFKKAQEYLKFIEKKNPYFISYVEKGIEKEVPKNAKLGEESEVITVITEMSYLIDFTPHIKEFISKRGNV